MAWRHAPGEAGAALFCRKLLHPKAAGNVGPRPKSCSCQLMIRSSSGVPRAALGTPPRSLLIDGGAVHGP